MDMYKKQILWVVHSAEEHPCRENMFRTDLDFPNVEIYVHSNPLFQLMFRSKMGEKLISQNCLTNTTTTQ